VTETTFGERPQINPLVGDIAGRVAVVLCFAWQAGRLIQQWINTGRLSGLFFLAAGSLVVWFTVIRRPAVRVEPTLSGRLVAIIGTFAPLGFRPASLQVLPDAVLAGAILAGALLAFGSIFYLGRNFGIIAAHRGVSQLGPYSVVRHPLYASYFIMHVGYVGANVSAWNLCLWIAAESAQIARTVYEERILRTDPQYRAYQQRVRWRMLPGVF